MLGFSKFTKEYTKFHFTSLCPSCRKMNVVPRIIDSKTGETLSLMTFIWNYPKTAVRVCTKCSARISLYPNGDLRSQRAGDAVEISETSITEEAIGSEERTINNLGSDTGVRRRFSVSKEWSRSYVIEHEELSKLSSNLSIGPDKASTIGLAAEESIRKNYSVSDGERHQYAEEVEIDVPARTKVRIVFHWKRLWQHGVVKVSAPAGGEAILSFKIVRGLTFDQSQQDEEE